MELNEEICLLSKKTKRKKNKKEKEKENKNVPCICIEISKRDDDVIAIIKKNKIHFDTDNSLFKKGRQNINADKIINNNKLYENRYYLFSLYDNGIKMDDESWYSVTPEEIAIYISSIIDNSSSFNIIDAFCGCGGNTIQFSKKFSHVYAIDISKEKIELTKHNTKVYSCDDNISFINDDFFNFNNKGDYIFLSPPWGGVEYKYDDNFSLKKWITPDIDKIIEHSITISKNLIFYLPRNTIIDELIDLIVEKDKRAIVDNDNTLFIDVRYLESAYKNKAILVLYGEKFNSVKAKEIKGYLINEFYKDKIRNVDAIRKCVNIAKAIGASRFFKEIFLFNKDNKQTIQMFIKYMFDNVMDAEDKEEYNRLIKEERNKSEKISLSCVNMDIINKSVFDIMDKSEYEIAINKQIKC